MEVASVVELPWPHFPFKCRFKADFEAAVACTPRWEDRPSIVAEVISGIADAEIRRCSYHATDWVWAAEAAISCWRSADPDALREAATWGRAQGASERTLEGLASFFAEPIFLNGGLIGNGQHRVCAMKIAGVPECLIAM